MNKTSRGFTVIEIIFVIALLALGSVIFFVQKNNLEVGQKDTARKTSINAMYYSLEEVYFKENNSYPRTITETSLRSVDPALLKDTNGVLIGQPNSEFRYEPTGCEGGACSGYTLRTILNSEDDYVKENR